MAFLGNQQYDEDQQMERPTVTDSDVQDTGEALEANPFTISESFKKLDTGEDEREQERPNISEQDIQESGSGLEPNPFTVSETFRKLDEGGAPSIFAGGATGKETVFKKVHEPQANLRGTEPPNLKVCVVCHGPLKGRFVKIREKGMHNDCFNCSVCGDPLKGRGYFEQDGKFFCRKDRPL